MFKELFKELPTSIKALWAFVFLLWLAFVGTILFVLVLGVKWHTKLGEALDDSQRFLEEQSAKPSQGFRCKGWPRNKTDSRILDPLND